MGIRQERTVLVCVSFIFVKVAVHATATYASRGLHGAAQQFPTKHRSPKRDGPRKIAFTSGPRKANPPKNKERPISDNLIPGITRFRRGYFRKNREKYLALVRNGQNPAGLFITCADSRIIPHAVTGTDPGDLFVIRNVGNMVPPNDGSRDCLSTGAGIEYAVNVLGVREITVCGHSHCGACAALYQDQADPDMLLTAQWLEQGRAVRDLVLHRAAREFEPGAPIFRSRAEREQVLRATEKAMVVQHLQNLMSYPAVARRVAAGDLKLNGWCYEIESGHIEAYDPERLAFVPIGQGARPALRQAA
jgi:carbonic anhydrase